MTAGRAPRPPIGTGCSLVDLGRFDEPRGSLCVAEVGQHVGFEIKRVYWIFDVPEGFARANHTHRVQHEILVAVSGSFEVHCDDGFMRERWTLDSPDTGLLIAPMVFHHVDAFSPGALCLVLASGPYDPAEYVHDYDEFRELANRR